MCVYFEAAFDDELSFGSAPEGPPTSWGSPLLRVESRAVHAGDTLEFRLTAADLATPRTWEWTVDVTPAPTR